MARSLIVTPRCEATGLPLLPDPTIKDDSVRVKNWSDFHHGNSPSSAPQLHTLAGKARRVSWGITLNRSIHDWYTDRYAGPNLDISPEEELQEVVFACAGIRPRNAIELTPHNQRVITLSEEEFISMGRVIHFEDAYHPRYAQNARATIGRYFAHCALSQDVVVQFKESTIEEMLDSKTKQERRYELGNQIIKTAIGLSIEDLVPVYKELVSEGYSMPTQHRSLHSAVAQFFTKRYFSDYHETVTERLALSYAT